MAGLVVLVAVAVVAMIFAARGGAQAGPGAVGSTVYTYVSQFQVPRDHWAAYSAEEERNFVPVAERLMADGTIEGWSTFESVDSRRDLLARLTHYQHR
jgi:hypothetical protein